MFSSQRRNENSKTITRIHNIVKLKPVHAHLQTAITTDTRVGNEEIVTRLKQKEICISFCSEPASVTFYDFPDLSMCETHGIKVYRLPLSCIFNTIFFLLYSIQLPVLTYARSRISKNLGTVVSKV